jgi:hypothetical protein
MQGHTTPTSPCSMGDPFWRCGLGIRITIFRTPFCAAVRTQSNANASSNIRLENDSDVDESLPSIHVILKHTYFLATLCARRQDRDWPAVTQLVAEPRWSVRPVDDSNRQFFLWQPWVVKSPKAAAARHSRITPSSNKLSRQRKAMISLFA